MSRPPFTTVFAIYPNLTHLDFTGPHQVLCRIPGATTVIASVVAMFILDWRLAIFSLGLLPFFVALGAAGGRAAGEGAAGRRIHASVEYGAIGMDAYAFGA